MQIHRSNRLLPVLGLAMLAVFVLIVQRGCNDNSDDDGVLMETVPSVPAPDADTPKDTITTLTANVAAMTRELQRLQKDNADLKADNRQLLQQRGALEDAMSTRIAAEMARLRQQSVDDDAETVAALHRRIDALTESLTRLPPTDNDALPIGFGFDTPAATDEVVWIEPLDGISNPTSGLPGMPRALGTHNPESLGDPVQPRFTVPRNATLLGATALTAMLGRVPVRGEVRDPMPFKVLTGVKNLAANGYSVPGVAGMVWSGTAIGDWTLSCVRGELHSVTFVFADGRIQTLSSGAASGESGDGRRALGWVSDDRGVPCVSGARKSNAAHYLSQRIAAKTVEAAADAAAAAQTNTVLRDSGAVSSAVGGEVGAFVIGRSAADGSAELARWLAERQAQAFDAVFVPAGTDLVIHVDRELAIDFDPHARKLHYVADTDAADTEPTD